MVYLYYGKFPLFQRKQKTWNRVGATGICTAICFLPCWTSAPTQKSSPIDDSLFRMWLLSWTQIKSKWRKTPVWETWNCYDKYFYCDHFRTKMTINKKTYKYFWLCLSLTKLTKGNGSMFCDNIVMVVKTMTQWKPLNVIIG